MIDFWQEFKKSEIRDEKKAKRQKFKKALQQDVEIGRLVDFSEYKEKER